VESCYSITGSAADHRLPLRSSQIAAFVGRLSQEVERLSADQPTGQEHGGGESHIDKFVGVVASDLAANSDQCVVAVGPRQPAEVHAAVHRLNAVLGNVGETVRYTRELDADRPGHIEAMTALAEDMHAGKVETLLVLGGNPVYDAPADLDFAGALEKVNTTIHASLYRNETSEACKWHVPQAHFLESWGDARSLDGTYSIVQPMIAPLHEGRTWIELLARILGDTLPKPEQLVRETFKGLLREGYDETLWRKTVHDGLWADSAWPDETVPEPKAVSLPTELDPAAPQNGDLELVFCRDASVYDGRFANSGWLQECPDPMTKLTWDNAARISPATAKSLGVQNETLVTLKLGDRAVTIPAYVMPGQADGSIAVSLGYGRTAAGYVGGLQAEEIAPVGVDAYPLRTGEAMYVAAGLSVESTGTKHRLATTHDHYAIDTAGFEARAERVGALIREASLEEYKKHPDFAKHAVHHPPLESMWEEHKYEGHRWGMSIDLSKCIGCNACVVACQAENNVPVVGKEQVLRGREMHWIRVDRYFKGNADKPEDLQMAMQPVACHHCELAPCEQVCPVAATVHTSEGLNAMVYNRCIGTRYCANNCPYKVRRFNYFNYHKELDDANREVTKMAFNPEVTVRSRGVMEKCTYCVQRIQGAKIEAKNEGRPIQDGEIKTACQQACPTQAIVFGDLADDGSQVAGHQRDDRSYAMLAELNVKPRTAYLAKIRNPHPELESNHNEREHHDG
jgi:molybdopterin-containing oxidoreductase family iron-sulfur binding subunit